ncbi:MAG: 6-phosphofructokinase, partial [Actinomycetota bacterium]
MVTPPAISHLAVLTSGGDAPGMNAAVRAVVRTALGEGLEVSVIHEGFLGLVDGGPAIQPASSASVGGILQRGGTWIGTARSEAFRTREGRRRAAANLVERGIDALVVIGGDGSLTGANLFRSEWPELLDELAESGELPVDPAVPVRRLALAGIVGSIDNDMFGTDMTIGADTALHRITEAVDALRSTASSHQRSFVIEVMGRNCGYLALMSAIATGANWVFIPEHPPATEDWEGALRRTVETGRRMGRRQNLVIVAEGARDLRGRPITAGRVREVLEEGLGEDCRVTILGHVQRGGAPSAFDRNLGTQCGYHAVQQLLRAPDDEPQIVGLRENRIETSPLMAAVERTHAVADLLERQEFDEAMRLRGGSFTESWETMKTLVRAHPRRTSDAARPLRLAVMHGGGPAPGMNTAVRAVVRIALDDGHTMLGVRGGYTGLVEGRLDELEWMSVNGWGQQGGAELGTDRRELSDDDLRAIAATIERERIDGIMLIGGYAGYAGVHRINAARHRFPSLDVPMVCLPATINNDVPGTELSIGADTALNSIVSDVDKIKQSAVATHRVFVVEVMGRDSGFLALNAGLATGAEQIYTPEEGITLDGLRRDVDRLNEGFQHGQRLGLIIRSEGADAVYTTPFLWALFEKEGGDRFDVRQAILGHVQQGGNPTPFDRIQSTRLAGRCVS